MSRIVLKLSILIMFVSGMQIQAQNISFQLYGKSVCNDSIFLIELYSLEHISSEKKYQALDGTICLADTGGYKLTSIDVGLSENITLKVRNIGMNSDTVIVMSVYKILPIHSDIKREWECCGTTCQGYYIDYYNNGNKRIEGEFKKGRPVGKITYYKSDGSVMYVDYYNKKGKLVETE